MSGHVFCYWVCDSGGRDVSGGARGHRRGAVLIRLVLQSGIWHFPSTPAPDSLSLSLASPGLSQTLNSQPDCLPYSVDTGSLLHQSPGSLTPVLLSSLLHARALAYAHSHTSTESKFSPRRQLSVCQFTHFDMFWRFAACVNYYNCRIPLLFLLSHDQLNLFWSMLTG